jgi:hypothetical protein
MLIPDGKKLALIVLSAALIAGCASIKTGSHRDEGVSLDGYRTFTWITDDPLILAAGDQAQISPLTKKKIVDTIEKTLSDKGYTYTSNRNYADFVVSYAVGTREKIDAYSYPVGYGGAWDWHLHGRYYYDADVQHRSYTEGTLGIDIFDGRSNQPVWHGWATKTISSADRENPSPLITTAVEGVLALFPSFSK